MYRDILVHIDGKPNNRHRLESAVDLAMRMRARLCGLHVMPTADIPPLYKPSQIDAAVAHLSAELASEARAARLSFEVVAAARLADTEWHEMIGDMVEGVSTRARYADLVVLGQDEWQDPVVSHPLPIAHSLVVRCGRPVLVVPAHVQAANFRRIALAWDGSREAVRAIHDALPLLKTASAVHLLTVFTEPDANTADDTKSFVSHLAGHGVTVDAKSATVTSGEEHDALERIIRDGAYDLLVMGAYSRPRWMEFVFGGATKTELLSSTIPVLVSH